MQHRAGPMEEKADHSEQGIGGRECPAELWGGGLNDSVGWANTINPSQ